jgi:hypothetical protein
MLVARTQRAARPALARHFSSDPTRYWGPAVSREQFKAPAFPSDRYQPPATPRTLTLYKSDFAKAGYGIRMFNDTGLMHNMKEFFGNNNLNGGRFQWFAMLLVGGYFISIFKEDAIAKKEQSFFYEEFIQPYETPQNFLTTIAAIDELEDRKWFSIGKKTLPQLKESTGDWAEYIKQVKSNHKDEFLSWDQYNTNIGKE